MSELRGLMRIVVPLLVAAACLGCRGKAGPGAGPGKSRQGSHASPQRPPVDPAVQAAAESTVLKEAQDAVAEVMKHVGDCDALRSAYAAANLKLDAAVRKVRSDSGKATLQELQTQAGQAVGRCE